MDAGYVEGGIFLNSGDLLQMWSGEKIMAPVSSLSFQANWLEVP